MSGIRVTYSGLISFAVKLSTILTGIMFTVIVTRQLSEQEFGTWSLLGSLLLYVVFTDYVVSFWLTREVARGVDSARTALISSIMFSVGGTFAYLIIAYFVSIQANIDYEILFFGAILIFPRIINDILHFLNFGWKPQIISYALLGSEIVKVPAALVLIYFFNLGLEGAILATFISSIISISIHFLYSRHKLRAKFQKKFLKKWFRLSWIPLYHSIPNLAYVSDVVIFSLITGSVIGVAYVTAARAIARIVMNTGALSIGIYPKLLEGGPTEHLQEIITKVFYFVIPLMGLSITLARPGLFALNPVYEIAVPVVIILSFRSLFTVINKLFHSALQGIETVDIDENATFKSYVKSKLFLLPTLRVIQYGSYVVVLIIVLSLLTLENSEIELIIAWSIVALLIEVPFVIYLYILVRKNMVIKVDYKSLVKYLISGIISFGILHILVEQFLDYRISIFEFLPELLLFVATGVGLYFGITYSIDKKTRKLFKAIISEIKQK